MVRVGRGRPDERPKHVSHALDQLLTDVRADLVQRLLKETGLFGGILPVVEVIRPGKEPNVARRNWEAGLAFCTSSADGRQRENMVHTNVGR